MLCDQADESTLAKRSDVRRSGGTRPLHSAERDSPKYEKAALRWLERYPAESSRSRRLSAGRTSSSDTRPTARVVSLITWPQFRLEARPYCAERRPTLEGATPRER